MNTIIAGTRRLTDPRPLAAALADAQRRGLVVTAVLSGGAAGPDALGERWARQRGLPVRRLAADWRRYGRGAGPRRNADLVAAAGPDGALLALWDGESAGTRDVIERARRAGLQVHVYVLAVGTLRRLPDPPPVPAQLALL